jgi:pyridoxal phosphate enzyme (YggS family)
MSYPNSGTASVSPDPAENLKSVLRRIEQARHSAIALGESVRLVAVTKTQAVDRIVPVLESGHRIFGENRVQEAKSKWPELRLRYPGIELHLIGPLQTNKAHDAVSLFDVIQTLDRPKLAEALKKEMEKSGRMVRLFVQVNTGEEPQKAGIAPQEAVAFARHCRGVLGLPVVGMMCIPPLGEEPALHFALLNQLAKDAGLEFLSMGMSDDFETAIRFGATHVRVGTAIFGPRLP